MIDALRRLFWVSRPVSWPNTAYPFIVGYILAGGAVSPMLVVAGLFFLVPYNVLMYGVNDVFDYESDIRNPRKGGIEGMREQRQFHPFILRASVWLCVPFVAYMLWQGSPVANLVLVALLFFVVAYSLKGLRFKERPLLDSVTSSLHFSGPLVYALSLTGWPAQATPFVIAFFLWGVASHAFGAVQDIVPDREGGIASVATWLGARHTVRMSAMLYVVASLLVAQQGMRYVPIALVGLLYAANVYPYLSVSDTASGSSNRAWRRFIWLNLITGAVVTITLLSRLVG